MTSKQFAAVAAVGVFVLAAVATSSLRLRAEDDDNGDARVSRGFKIAPVHLNLRGKNRELVGLGSYIVNAQADCNGCHSAGPETEFTFTGNPYFLRPPFSGKKKFNPATYLGGGNNFGPVGPVSPAPDIVSRNLTPGNTGLPEGDHTFLEFRTILRTGKDFDGKHPSCGKNPPDGKCQPAPFNGEVLQIMPWVIYQDMSDHELRAIYEYLSAIPCLPGPGKEHPCF